MTTAFLLALQVGEPASGPNALDHVFGYGALLLLVTLVWWNARSQGPPR